MIIETDIVNLVSALIITERKESYLFYQKWNTMNIWYKLLARDKRYKIYHGCIRDNGSGIWFIGDPDRNGRKVYVQRDNDIWYARFVNNDLYQRKPCWKVERLKGGAFKSEWQDEVRI